MTRCFWNELFLSVPSRIHPPSKEYTKICKNMKQIILAACCRTRCWAKIPKLEYAQMKVWDTSLLMVFTPKQQWRSSQPEVTNGSDSKKTGGSVCPVSVRAGVELRPLCCWHRGNSRVHLDTVPVYFSEAVRQLTEHVQKHSQITAVEQVTINNNKKIK